MPGSPEEPSERTAFRAIRTSGLRRRIVNGFCSMEIVSLRFYISVYICTCIATPVKPVIYPPCRRLRLPALQPGTAAGRVCTASCRAPHDQTENQQGVNYEDHRSLAAQLRRRPRSAAARSSFTGADESAPERAGSDVCDSQRQCRSVRDRQHVGAELRERLRRRHRVLPDDRRLATIAICPGFTATQSSIAWSASDWPRTVSSP